MLLSSPVRYPIRGKLQALTASGRGGCGCQDGSLFVLISYPILSTCSDAVIFTGEQPIGGLRNGKHDGSPRNAGEFRAYQSQPLISNCQDKGRTGLAQYQLIVTSTDPSTQRQQIGGYMP